MHRPLVDRQHPHDFLMQAAVVWRVPLPRGVRADARRRAGRRTGARARRLHAPRLGVREPDRAARASHLRLDPHQHGRAHGGRRARRLEGRRLGLPRRRARRAAVGPDGSRCARLVVGPRLVSARNACGRSRSRTDSSPTPKRPIPATCAGRRRPRRGPHAATNGWTAATVAYGPQQRAGPRLHARARRSHARLRRHHDLRTCRARRSRDVTCCDSASTSSSAAARHTCPKASAASIAIGAFTLGGRAHDRAAVGLGPRRRRRRHHLRVPRDPRADLRRPSRLLPRLLPPASTRADGPHGGHDDDIGMRGMEE